MDRPVKGYLGIAAFAALVPWAVLGEVTDDPVWLGMSLSVGALILFGVGAVGGPKFALVPFCWIPIALVVDLLDVADPNDVTSEDPVPITYGVVLVSIVASVVIAVGFLMRTSVRRVSREDRHQT